MLFRSLEKVLSELLEQNTTIILTEVNASVKSMLSRMGLVRKLGIDHFIDEVPEALAYIQTQQDAEQAELEAEELAALAEAEAEAEEAADDEAAHVEEDVDHSRPSPVGG